MFWSMRYETLWCVLKYTRSHAHRSTTWQPTQQKSIKTLRSYYHRNSLFIYVLLLAEEEIAIVIFLAEEEVLCVFRTISKTGLRRVWGVVVAVVQGRRSLYRGTTMCCCW
jgi:hypothetical protein